MTHAYFAWRASCPETLVVFVCLFFILELKKVLQSEPKTKYVKLIALKVK